MDVVCLCLWDDLEYFLLYTLIICCCCVVVIILIYFFSPFLTSPPSEKKSLKNSFLYLTGKQHFFLHNVLLLFEIL